MQNLKGIPTRVLHWMDLNYLIDFQVKDKLRQLGWTGFAKTSNPIKVTQEEVCT